MIFKKKEEVLSSQNEIEEVLLKITRETEIFGGNVVSELRKRIFDFPSVSGIDFYKGYEINQYSCPDCEAKVGDEIFMFNFCPMCGKKLKKL